MTKIEEELKNKLDDLPSFFEGGEEELAYLLLTGKPEEHIRDKIAYRLQNENGYNTAREWVSPNIDNKRFDLAVLNDNGDPQTVVEFKVGLSTDMRTESNKESILGDPDNKKEGVWKDIQGLKDVNCNQALAILLIIHPCQNPDPKVKDMIKYSDNFSLAFKKKKNGQEIKDECKKKIKKDLKIINEDLSDEVFAGKLFQTKIDLLYWIMPVRNKV